MLVVRELRRGGFDPKCVRVDTRAAFKDALERNGWQLIISDYSLPHYDGLTALADVRASGKDIPFILVSGTIGEAVAVEAMRAGAQDYVLKDCLRRLPVAVEREVREAALRAEQRTLTERLAISERVAAAGMLAAGVAHEINNPLAVIMANLDFMASLLGSRTSASGAERASELAESLADAREAGERIRAIVRDMKLFSRPRHEAREPVDVRRVVESSIRMARNEIVSRARLVREFGDVPTAETNEARLGQILLNLLVNAAQSIPEGGAASNVIRVVTKLSEAGAVVIEVRDTGSGMPKEILARVFDPFFTTKPVGVGTGLGLALCHRMVTDLDGEIAVESEVGKGTVFRVTLPASPGEPQATAEVRETEIATRRARVLVIDDEVAVGRALERSLRRHHDVVLLTSGKEALARISAGERFDAIFSDLMMPQVSGMDLFERLSQIAIDQAKKMIFVTGGAFTERGREFLGRVPNPRIEKPFEIANILAMIAGMPRL